MSDKKEDPAAVAAGCLLTLVSIPVSVLLTGWAIHLLWGWFVTDPFGVASPGRWNCYGLALLAALAVGRARRPKDTTALEDGVADLYLAVAKPLVFVGLGWVLVQIRAGW